MIRRAFALFTRHLPFVAKRVALFTAVYSQQRDVKFSVLSCSALQDGRRWLIEKIETMSIKIKLNGQTIGHAYFFADNYLVSVRYCSHHTASNSSKIDAMPFTNFTSARRD